MHVWNGTVYDSAYGATRAAVREFVSTDTDGLLNEPDALIVGLLWSGCRDLPLDADDEHIIEALNELRAEQAA